MPEPTMFEKLKKALNIYGTTAEKISPPPKKKADPRGTFTSPEEQEKMRKDLETARTQERMKNKLKK